jgi:CBS domain containing-hemolysin-like protein
MSDRHREQSPHSAEQRRPNTPTLFDRMRALFGLGVASIRDDIEDALAETDAAEVFSPQERAILKNVLNLHEIRVEDVMVPRADIIAIGSKATLKTVLALFRESGHSRLLVHGDTLDHPKGMVHIRDFVDYITEPVAEQESGTVAGASVIHIDMAQSLEGAGIMRSVLFVPPSMQALDLLVRMQAMRTHMAIVIDEYGGTDGLVTIEDIVEVIVGDIEDEHDETERPKIVESGAGVFIADARASLDEVVETVRLPVATAEEHQGVDTIGGLVTSLAGRVPLIGEAVPGHEAFDFVILESDRRHVKRVQLQRKTDYPSHDQAPSVVNDAPGS